MDFNKVQRAVDHAIDTRSATGASAVITKNGVKVFSYSTGLSDAENKIEFTENTICRAYSCSKIVTSVCVMQLMERGIIDTADELARYIPGFSEAFYLENGEKRSSPPIKIRDLLNMTSGIPYPWDGREGGDMTTKLWQKLDKSIRSGHSMSTQEYAAEAAGCALLYPAGREWMYGASADILGAVIEKASDMPLDEYMKANVFDPLGMDDTAFFVPAEKLDRLAVLYEGVGDSLKKPDYVNLCIYDSDKTPEFISGGAGLFSTASDYSKLGAELSCRKAGILSEKTIEFMQKKRFVRGTEKHIQLGFNARLRLCKSAAHTR